MRTQTGAGNVRAAKHGGELWRAVSSKSCARQSECSTYTLCYLLNRSTGSADSAETGVVACRVQREGHRLVARVAPIPAMNAGERRDEGSRFAFAALADLIALVKTFRPLTFGGLAVKFEIQRASLRRPFV